MRDLVPRTSLALALLAGVAIADPPIPSVPPGNDIFGRPNSGPDMNAYPGSLSGATLFIGLPANTINGRFGSNAIAHRRLVSGPMKWTSGNTNEGDIDFVIGPAAPSDVRSFPTWSGWDAYREDQGILSANPLPAALPLPTSQWPDSENWGRLRLTGSFQYAPPNFSWGVHPAHGILLGTVATNGRNNFNVDRDDRVTPQGTFYAHAHVSDDGGQSTGRGYNPITGNFEGTGLYMSTFVVGERPGNQDECVTDMAVAYFPYEQGWIGGYHDGYAAEGSDWRVRDGLPCSSPNLPGSVAVGVDGSSALYRITLPDASPDAGMLLLQPCGDDNDESMIAGVLPQSSDWLVAMRQDYNTDTTGTTLPYGTDLTRFVFVYVPWSAGNLLAAQVAPDGSSVHAAGSFTLTHPSTGNYELSIPGKTDNDGTLIITSAGSIPGDTLLPDRAFYSFQYNAQSGKFVIQSRELTAGNNTWAEDYPLRDAGFYFMWIDFTSPATPGGSACPTCPADFNQDGGVDGSDVEAFFLTWESGNSCGDVNQDGGVDGGDVESFFLVWENGGC